MPPSHCASTVDASIPLIDDFLRELDDRARQGLLSEPEMDAIECLPVSKRLRDPEDARRLYDIMVSKLRDLFSRSEEIFVYRSINVENVKEFVDMMVIREESDEMRGAGIHWSWDELAAFGYECGEGDEILLRATVGCKDIDFFGTLAAHMLFTVGPSGDESYEKEIRLLADRRVYVDSIRMPPSSKTIPIRRHVWT